MLNRNVGGAVKLGKVLITSAWPYINYVPHLGTLVGSILSADVVARYHRLKGEDVLMVSGSDEHGTPIEVESIRLGISPKELTDKNHAKVVELLKKWKISFDNYTRTESPVHKEFVQDHLMKIYNNGYIFVKETEMPYCEKCSRFLPDRFVEGKCPYCGYESARGDQCDACGKLLEPTFLIESYCVICKGKPIIKKTKHWYFDMSKFSQKLSDYISSNKQLPSNARNFSLNLIKEGLKPRTVTRDVSWGIPAPFPEAEGKTIYVWIEAVLGYVSATIEYFRNRGEPEKWKKYWFNRDAKTIYFVGKDNIPFHAIILPALLLASHEDYNLPWNVSSTEFLQFKGESASKSRRIGIFTDEALELFPADYWRFFLMATRPETKDTDFSWELFTEKINADLNDTFGNFIHRTLMFINTRFNSEVPKPSRLDKDDEQILKTLKEKVETIAKEIESCRLQSAANIVISISRVGNQYLNEKEPWNVIKKDRDKAANTIYVAAQIVKALAMVSAPFIPFAAEELWKTLNIAGSVHEQKWEEALKPLPASHKIAKAKPLFQKIEADSEKLGEMLEKVRESLAKAA
ncbi:MAG: methionine--tRNA ligase [Candidatus Bathyarchaeia archaeon]|nr:methionine--tRNA ligase [Candidatus Bathyarchaeia archaeon]